MKAQKLQQILFVFIFGLLLLGFNLFPAFAQKETNFWYFGAYAGVSFDSGSPVAVTDGILSTNEGCATISDSDGQLLFYTSGNRVFNRNHIQMPNGFGLAGDASSSQAAVIAPLPGSNTIYYIFTVDEEGNSLGFRYTIIDLSLAGGLGDVVMKNVLLLTPVSEKVTAVKHNNNFDIWIITHEWDSDAFYAYLLNAAGISASPVISNTGLVHTGGSLATNGNSAGYMKASPLGNKLALAIKEMNLYQIFDFNTSNGIVSNPITTPATYSNAYGVEFSADGTKFYGSKYGFGNPQIYQFNLEAATPAAILASATLVGTSSSLFGGAIQLGLDEKIYFARHQSDWLGVIQNPNALGLACGYIDDGVFLNGPTSNFGLPNFVQSYLKPMPFTYTNTCFGDATEFELVSTAFVASVSWNFGDSASGSNNTSTQFSPSHIFSAPDVYTVSLTITLTNGVSETVSQNVMIHHVLTGIDLGTDQILCPSETITLTPIAPGVVTYLWQNGSTSPTFTVTQEGLYSVTVSNVCGSVSDLVSVSYNSIPEFDLGINQSLCEGQTLVLNAAPTNGALFNSYQWGTGETTSSYTVSTEGLYTVTVANPCGYNTGSVNIDFIQPPDIEIGNDALVCQGIAVTLDATPLNQSSAGTLTYIWQNGSITPLLNTSVAGTYSVTVSNVCGTATDQMTLDNLYPPNINFGPDADLCPGESLLLDATTLGGSYLWQDGSTLDVFTVTQSGNYWVEVTNSCGTQTEDINVNYQALSSPDLGPDFTLCSGQTLVLDATTAGVNYIWQDGTTTPVYTVSVPGEYWVQINNGCSSASDTVVVSYELNPTIDLGPDIQICEGESITLDISFSDIQATYLWNDGSTNPVKTFSQSGLYTATITNPCGSVTDGVNIFVIPLPVVELGNDAILCPGESLVIEAANPNTNAYLWNTGSVDSEITVSDSGQYSVTVFNACGTANDFIYVDVGTNLNVNLGPDMTLCNNETITLSATTPGVNYLWQDNSTNSTLSVSEPGTYWVQISNNCSSATDTIALSYLSSASINLLQDTVLCQGQMLTIDATQSDNSLNYVWQDGSINPIFTATQAGIYAVTVSNVCGAANDQIALDYIHLPVVSISGANTICIGDTITLFAVSTNSDMYLWQDGSSLPTLIVTGGGFYEVSVQNQCGTAQDMVTITSNDCTPPDPPDPLPCTFLVPNAYSPNNDGINDVFRPVYNCLTEYVKMEVYNRWGQLVYESENLDAGWNGKFHNENCPVGVYVWILEYQNQLQEIETLKGNITLIR